MLEGAQGLGNSDRIASGAPSAFSRHCVNCGTLFTFDLVHKGRSRRFCEPACQKKFNNRAVSQGMPLVALIMAWRLARNSAPRKQLGAQAFAQLVELADSLIDEEREEGRSSAMILDYAAELIAEGSVIDRCRRRERKRVERRIRKG